MEYTTFKCQKQLPLKMIRVTEADVYNALSYHDWKRPLVIFNQLCEEKKVDDKPFQRPSIGTVYNHLDSLVEKGFSEFRMALLTEDELNSRGGWGSKEYKLTRNGLKNNHLYDTQEPGIGQLKLA